MTWLFLAQKVDSPAKLMVNPNFDFRSRARNWIDDTVDGFPGYLDQSAFPFVARVRYLIQSRKCRLLEFPMFVDAPAFALQALVCVADAIPSWVGARGL